MTLDEMTCAQIREAMVLLCGALAEKGVITPQASLTINDSGKPNIHMSCRYDTEPFDGEKYKVIFGDDCIDQAMAYVAAMPSPDTAHLHAFMRKLADAVDYGHANNIPAEYVDPVRITQKAMSDNLLVSK
jgi:hypothetical protein